ncbi:hypothetical protein Tco_1200216 [Tanacetum coccineum]
MRHDLPSSSGNHSRPPPPHPAAIPSPPRHHRHHHHHILIISISMPPSHHHLHIVIITTTTPPPPLSSSPPRLHHSRFILSTMAAGAFGFTPRWVRLVDEWQQGTAFGSVLSVTTTDVDVDNFKKVLYLLLLFVVGGITGLLHHYSANMRSTKQISRHAPRTIFIQGPDDKKLLLVLGEADSGNSRQKESMKKAFQDMLHELRGEVNLNLIEYTKGSRNIPRVRLVIVTEIGVLGYGY